MPIIIDEKNLVFNLQTPNTSYVLAVNDGFVEHIHYGKRVDNAEGLVALAEQKLSGKSSFCAGFNHINVKTGEIESGVTAENMLCEYPTFGHPDLRSPAFHAKYADGSRLSDLRYAGYRVSAGKQPLSGLPATYVEADSEADTLEIITRDELTGVEVVLNYTAFANHDAITRHAVVTNGGCNTVELNSVLSLNLPFNDHNFNFIHLDGSWARERHIESQPLRRGFTGVDSRRGASSHVHNPFVVLARPDATEESGEVYGSSLVYSGNFIAEAYVDATGATQLQMGLNPFDFGWKLESGESFTAPEAVLVYSDAGFGKMSRTYHKLYRTRLCRGKYRDGGRPVLINNWEATYFDFNEEKILAIADRARRCGVELMVLDDGWFGKRDLDNCSLGDWYAHKDKLPDGIAGIANKIVQSGMKFGLWFEPEMVSPDSDLYRAHPDWCLHVEGRRRSLSRTQLVLDMSRAEVIDYLYERMSDILSSAPISYVKWDMNRNMTEVGSAALPADRQQEVSHRYMLGLYSLLDRLNTAFPDVLFEGCSGGGGRFDPGMLYYSPQIWTSDDGDAIERLKIQHGTSMVYPLSSMGAHVTAVPNHIVGRVNSISTRADVATLGQFGYELDLNTLTDEEIELVKAQIIRRKELADIIHNGSFYRLRSPFEGQHTAWQIISEDGKTVLFFYCTVLCTPCSPMIFTRLRDLDGNAVYAERGTDNRFSGDALMNVGLGKVDTGDFVSHLIILDKVE